MPLATTNAILSVTLGNLGAPRICRMDNGASESVSVLTADSTKGTLLSSSSGGTGSRSSNNLASALETLSIISKLPEKSRQRLKPENQTLQGKFHKSRSSDNLSRVFGTIKDSSLEPSTSSTSPYKEVVKDPQTDQDDEEEEDDDDDDEDEDDDDDDDSGSGYANILLQGEAAYQEPVSVRPRLSLESLQYAETNKAAASAPFPWPDDGPVKCSLKKGLSCSAAVGCAWCRLVPGARFPLETSFCAPQSVCYGGVLYAPSPYPDVALQLLGKKGKKCATKNCLSNCPYSKIVIIATRSPFPEVTLRPFSNKRLI
ncbi:unnamed protein product [Protopolystoma xenopodis]|uniref:Uncharacterized protein n=1 Tax=Protopolystoma xenopodis TaxID=117903 RepID=A0A3S5FE89_9PLAT|nr:unnamed protein product [Protopolystoma xenopodis]